MLEKLKNKFFGTQKSGTQEFKVIPRKNNCDFKSMTPSQKKEFLSNDLIERMIRIEQRVSGQFGRFVKYNQTEYYASLSPTQKSRFEDYLKNKGKKKVFISFLFLLPIFILFIANSSFTGNVVQENINNTKYASYVNYILIGFVVLLFVFIILSWIYRNKKKKKYDSHFNVIENIYLHKRFLN